jgi:hypothetical protein
MADLRQHDIDLVIVHTRILPHDQWTDRPKQWPATVPGCRASSSRTRRS